MFGVSRVTPPHCHGHTHRCADVCGLYVCVQEEQAADSWAKAKTYTVLREGDKLRDTQRDREKEGDVGINRGYKKQEKADR